MFNAIRRSSSRIVVEDYLQKRQSSPALEPRVSTALLNPLRVLLDGVKAKPSSDPYDFLVALMIEKALQTSKDDLNDIAHRANKKALENKEFPEMEFRDKLIAAWANACFCLKKKKYNSVDDVLADHKDKNALTLAFVVFNITAIVKETASSIVDADFTPSGSLLEKALQNHAH